MSGSWLVGAGARGGGGLVASDCASCHAPGAADTPWDPAADTDVTMPVPGADSATLETVAVFAYRAVPTANFQKKSLTIICPWCIERASLYENHATFISLG